jgi:hypothetical protein
LIIDRHLCTREEAIFAYESLGCSLIRCEKYNEGILSWKKSLVERLVELIMKKKYDLFIKF